VSARWWAIFALLALAQQGCTIGGGGPAAPSERPLPPPPSESVRRSIREVWVAAGNTPPVLVLPAQMDKVEGTSVGAAEGFLVALAVTAEAAGPSSGDLAGAAVLLVGAVAIPVGTVAGAVADNWQGSERHAIGRHRQALVSVAKDLSLQRAAQARLVGYGSVLTPLQFHVAPTAPPGPYLPRTGTAVLEVPVERFGLTGPRARGAPLECFILARVAL
jgi:hypothetical protein